MRSFYASFSEEVTILPILAHSPDHKPPSWCAQSEDLNLNLDFEMSFNPDLTMYVSPSDKELIHLHLMVTSVFLFAILAAVIIAFLMRTVNRKDHVILSQIDTDTDNV